MIADARRRSLTARKFVATLLRRRMKVEHWIMTRNGSGPLRKSIALTHRAIEALRPDTIPYRISDQRCAGLAVRVAPSGLITWDLAFRIRKTGRFRRSSLGRFPHISLEDARKRAIELTQAAQVGL